MAKHGVIFCSISEAVKEYPELVKKYMGSVVSGAVHGQHGEEIHEQGQCMGGMVKYMGSVVSGMIEGSMAREAVRVSGAVHV